MPIWHNAENRHHHSPSYKPAAACYFQVTLFQMTSTEAKHQLHINYYEGSEAREGLLVLLRQVGSCWFAGRLKPVPLLSLSLCFLPLSHGHLGIHFCVTGKHINSIMGLEPLTEAGPVAKI